MGEKTIFEKIIDREIPAQFVYEDEVCVVVMDKFPVIPGQVLVIPRKAVDYIFDLDDETYRHIFAVAKKVSRALDGALNTVRTCLLVEGLEVPHVHIKLYPLIEPHLEIHGGSEADNQELHELAEKIKNALS